MIAAANKLRCTQPHGHISRSKTNSQRKKKWIIGEVLDNKSRNKEAKRRKLKSEEKHSKTFNTKSKQDWFTVTLHHIIFMLHTCTESYVQGHVAFAVAQGLRPKHELLFGLVDVLYTSIYVRLFKIMTFNLSHIILLILSNAKNQWHDITKLNQLWNRQLVHNLFWLNLWWPHRDCFF